MFSRFLVYQSDYVMRKLDNSAGEQLNLMSKVVIIPKQKGTSLKRI